MKCQKCESKRIIPNLRILDRQDRGSVSQNLEVAIFEKPRAWIFKRTKRSTLRASICGDCGFAELFATDPRGLLSAYKKSRQ